MLVIYFFDQLNGICSSTNPHNIYTYDWFTEQPTRMFSIATSTKYLSDLPYGYQPQIGDFALSFGKRYPNIFLNTNNIVEDDLIIGIIAYRDIRMAAASDELDLSALLFNICAQFRKIDKNTGKKESIRIYHTVTMGDNVFEQTKHYQSRHKEVSDLIKNIDGEIEIV